MVKIRLARRGRKSFALYDVVVADARSPRDGRYIEKIGTYNPNTDPATIELNDDKALDWVMKGAQPTDTVRAMLSYRGVMLKKHLQVGVLKGAITQEEADKKFAEWKEGKEKQIQAKIDRLAKEKDDLTKSRRAAETKVREARAETLIAKQKELEQAAIAAAKEAAGEEVESEEGAEAAADVAEAPAAEATEASAEVSAEETTDEPAAEAASAEAVTEEASEEPAAEAEAPTEEAKEETQVEAKEEAPEAEAAEEPTPEAKAEEAPAEVEATEAPEAETKEETPKAEEESAPEAEAAAEEAPEASEEESSEEKKEEK